MAGVAATIQTSKYRLIEEIGHGGMASVYRARDTRLDRDVALKLLHRHLRESEEVEARFNSEARAVAKLHHPNIVEVFDVSDETEPDRYLVVELIRGCTLRDVIKRRGALPAELGAGIALELLAALEHAHEQGVIHRDIKPENVLIELVAVPRASVDDLDRPRVKLTDFGIAKLLDAQGITSTGQVLGSPAHMAPEQIEGKSVDVRADVFSLGVLLYECIVGTLPFAGRNPAQVLRNVLEGNFIAPDVARPEVGARWSAIVLRALQREPENRYQTITEFAAAVRSELESLGFMSARRDVGAFLLDIEGYLGGFSDRIVPLLTAAGEAARKRGELVLASGQFGRALAYRPGDERVLSAISGLRRRRLVKQLLAGGVLALALGVLVVQGFRFAKSHLSQAKLAIAQEQAQPQGSNELSAVPSQTRLVAEPTRVSPGLERDGVERRTRRGTGRPSTETAEPLPTRQVSVRVTGAVGGALRIDGKERPWFGVVHSLEVGAHTFEFLPPDETCCVGSRRVVNITAGDTPEVVMGHIPFKDAKLVVYAEAAKGWFLSCPSLFSGQLELPGGKTIPLDQTLASGTCTLSNADQGFTAQRRVVTLRAGQTTVLPWL